MARRILFVDENLGSAENPSVSHNISNQSAKFVESRMSRAFDWLKSEAKKQFAQRRWDIAESLATASLEWQPQQGDLLRLRAAAAAELGNWSGAVSALSSLAAAGEAGRDDGFDLCLAYVEAGQKTEYAQLRSRTMSSVSMPSSATVHWLIRASVLTDLDEKEAEQMVAWAEQAVSALKTPQSQFDLARVFVRAGQPDRSVPVYERLAKIDEFTESPVFAAAYAVGLVRAKQPDEAQKWRAKAEKWLADVNLQAKEQPASGQLVPWQLRSQVRLMLRDIAEQMSTPR